jgi:hypothetical protein
MNIEEMSRGDEQKRSGKKWKKRGEKPSELQSSAKGMLDAKLPHLTGCVPLSSAISFCKCNQY